MRTATAEFGALVLATLRTGIAALSLMPLLLYGNRVKELLCNWRPILFVAIFNTAMPFALFSYSTFHLGAGYSSILNATAPMFGALVGFFWLKNKLSRIAIFGLSIGFLGVLLLSLARISEHTELAYLPIIAALVATFGYGLCACYSKQYLTNVSPITTAVGSHLLATLVLTPLSLFFLPHTNPSISSWLQVITLGLICTGIASVMYFRLIANVGAEKAITVAYLVPVFGVIWGVLLIQEVFTSAMALGAGLVLCGVALSTGVVSRASGKNKQCKPKAPI